VILVDDGLATGATMRAAVAALRREHAGRIVVAVPVASPETCAELRSEADAVICARTPEPFYAVGLWFEDFSQTTDDEVRDLLEQWLVFTLTSPRSSRGWVNPAVRTISPSTPRPSLTITISSCLPQTRASSDACRGSS
jgi:hypothetical protein